MANRLLPKHMAFVTSYLAGIGAARAAIEAGYNPSNARNRAAKLLRHPGVAAEIAAAQERLRQEANYTAEKAMSQLDDAIEFAKETKNATAYARCIELKAKLMGLLDEKSAAQASGFQIIINDVAIPSSKVIDNAICD